MKFLRHFQLTILFAWYDLWVGAFWDRKKRALYVFPVPCIGVCIDFGAPDLISRYVISRDGHYLDAPRVQFKLNP